MSAAEIDECEACLTPDTCRVRGTCDYYDASKLRVASRTTPRDELHELRERCEQQAAEIERLRADAKRYRWLRKESVHGWNFLGYYTQDALDDAIDAALAEQK